MKKSLLALCLFFVNHFLQAQSVPYPLNNDAVYHQIDRFEVLYGNDNFLQTTAKPYTRADVVRYALALDSIKGRMTKVDKAALQYIYDDNNELLTPPELPRTLTGKYDSAAATGNAPPQYRVSKRPILTYFYRTPANLYESHSRFFDVKINPIFNFKLAEDRGDDQPIFLNQRGIDVRGSVDNRVYFQTNIVETQARFPNYVEERIRQDSAIPGMGYYKVYNSLLFKIKNGYDYVNANGLVGFNITPHIGFQLGNGQHFIGDGMRSLLLSNFANNYFFMKLNTKVWKFQYQNIFAELSVNNNGISSGPINAKKFMATHQLSFNASSKLNFGLFETVIMHRTNQFELQYLNPIIFYRSVEHSLGSPDNVLIGANFKWNVANRLSVYGQAVLDEFLFKELFIDPKGWWANKYGVQIGVKYFNAFNIDHLDVQFEYNKVRPFTYSYYDQVDNYTHSLQNLAHPIGANFKEIMAKMRYQPTWKWVFDARLMYTNVGENDVKNLKTLENFGSNPLVANDIRKISNGIKQEYGYFTSTGINAKILLTTLDISYQFRHNMFADLHILARKKDSADPSRSERTFYVGGGVRLNLGNYRSDY
jgi:hypothetical protein